jgi:hypothetical protein
MPSRDRHRGQAVRRRGACSHISYRGGGKGTGYGSHKDWHRVPSGEGGQGLRTALPKRTEEVVCKPAREGGSACKLNQVTPSPKGGQCSVSSARSSGISGRGRSVRSARQPWGARRYRGGLTTALPLPCTPPAPKSDPDANNQGISTQDEGYSA